MTLPSPNTAVAGNARHPSALQGLPNELLLQIAGSTGSRGEGVNLSLRRVSKHMKDIADDQMSPKQRFFTENGQTLNAAGYNRNDMNHLFARPAAARDFVFTHAPHLRANGYKFAVQINDLAAQPDQRDAFLRQIGHRS